MTDQEKLIYTEAIRKTVDICKSKNILSKYLSERGQRVEEIMLGILNQENEVEAAAKEAREEGKREIEEEYIRKVIREFRKMNFNDGFILENIVEEYGLSEEEAKEFLREDS